MKVDEPTRGEVPQEVLDFWRSLSIEPDFDVEAAWAEEHAHAFRVSGVLAEDVLAGLHAAIGVALEQGRTFEAFRAELGPLLAALGLGDDSDDKRAPWRLRVVFDTNVRIAHAAGQWARIERTKDALPYLLYQLGPSQVHRPEHVAREGMIRAVDDPVWSSWMPPNGFGCKCWVRQLTSAEAERRGGETAAPVGSPDPGWDHNPGAVRLPEGKK